MASFRPPIVGIRLLLVAVLVLSVASTVTAAPGPLKGDPPPIESSNPEPEDLKFAAGEMPAAANDSEPNRLAFQSAAPAGVDGEPITSHRSSVASRTAAGSSPPADGEPAGAVPDPEVGRAQRSEPEPEPPEFARSPYEIQESGRPRQSADSIFAYDGDPATSWSAGTAAPQSYVWLDLGEERPVSGLRWFQPVVDGPVAIQISNDRQTWTTVVVDDQPVAGAWRQAEIGQAARFVRIVVGNRSQSAELAEVQIFGPPGSEPEAEEHIAAPQQRGDADRPPQVTITGGGESGRQSAAETVVVTPEPDSEAVEIIVNGETARCTGGERCRVETPRPEVVEDCGDGTSTCTIRISNSGGVAVCDSAGNNRGRNSDNGGSCAAEASGGTITVSDVNR